MKADAVTEVIGYHLEGPVWWRTTGQMRMVDMLAGAVLGLNPDGSVDRYRVGSKVAACLRPCTGGGAIVAREHDVAIGDAEDLSDLRTLTGDFIDAGLRFNEGGCDPQGRFYVGDMAYQRTVGAASLYAIGPGEARPQRVFDQVTTSNGIAFAADGSVGYYIDTHLVRIDRLDYSPEAGIVGRRPLVSFGPDDGRPDGLCLDAEGGIWVAMNKAGHVRRYGPEGMLEQRIEVAARQTTACNFGGEELDTLYITTSRENIPDGEDPLAGSLFAASPGVRGTQPLPYRR